MLQLTKQGKAILVELTCQPFSQSLHLIADVQEDASLSIGEGKKIGLDRLGGFQPCIQLTIRA
ncbi:hypothetical protein SDC9_199744 [bioreactor metagenome]|uniref:Uncharacterized protein n=1 Tax=bioreactor metagenome TaxID=1076179 RepID=A0A645ILW8_9ZZZZ